MGDGDYADDERTRRSLAISTALWTLLTEPRITRCRICYRHVRAAADSHRLAPEIQLERNLPQELIFQNRSVRKTHTRLCR
jgi:hypothetical protein